MKDWSSNETLEENLQKEESSSVKLLEGESKASDRRGGGGGEIPWVLVSIVCLPCCCFFFGIIFAMRDCFTSHIFNFIILTLRGLLFLSVKFKP